MGFQQSVAKRQNYSKKKKGLHLLKYASITILLNINIFMDSLQPWEQSMLSLKDWKFTNKATLTCLKGAAISGRVDKASVTLVITTNDRLLMYVFSDQESVILCKS